MIYAITGQGLKRIDTPENHAKNNLAIGTVLHLCGCNEPDYVIVKNLGIDEGFTSYGARYLKVSLEDHGQSQSNAFELKYLSEKKDNRIQLYITDKVLGPDEVLSIWETSEAKRKAMNEAAAKEEIEREKLIAKGKELFIKYILADAKALIIAERHQNESDIMTDYFAHSTEEVIILGYSRHTRDDFKEMRKHAAKIQETAHLENADKEAEHREKWSMGAGYYLKDGYSNSSGWAIKKVTKYRDTWGNEYFLSMGKRCIF